MSVQIEVSDEVLDFPKIMENTAEVIYFPEEGTGIVLVTNDATRKGKVFTGLPMGSYTDYHGPRIHISNP